MTSINSFANWNADLVSTLFAGSSSTSSGLDANLLLSALQPASTVSLSSAATSSSASASTPPTPPWNTATANTQAQLANAVQNGTRFINPSAITIDTPTTNTDYKKLFALYQGLNALQGLASQAASASDTFTQSSLNATFQQGLSQVLSYASSAGMQGMTFTQNEVLTADKATATVSAGNNTYTTQTIATGSGSDAAAAFSGPVVFSMDVKTVENGDTLSDKTVNFDLSQMGSTPRSIQNVVSYLNGQLSAAGVQTKFSVVDTPGAPQTITAGGKTINLGTTSPDQLALQVNGVPGEVVTFSAPSTADAVYVAQSEGVSASSSSSSSSSSASTLSQQVLKFQTNVSSTASAPPAPVGLPGQNTYTTAARQLQETLGSTVSNIQATAAGPNGSYYVLANINGTTGGHTIAGTQDVALQEYDSAGNLVYTRTLGAQSTATGLGLTVSASGEVAITGQETGGVGSASSSSSSSSSTAAQSFVSVYDASGNLSFTKAFGGAGGSQGNAVAFGADGSVYVSGTTTGPLTNSSSATGTSDAFVTGFSATGTQTFSQQWGVPAGASSANAVAVDGSTLYVGGTVGGDGVVKSFDLSNGGAPLATQNLGSLSGGSLTGLAVSNGQVIVAGTSANGNLNAGTVTAAASGHTDAFVATLSPSLTASSADQIAYYGGSGNESNVSLAVSQSGNVYLTGSTTGSLPGTTQKGAQDAFVAQIDVATGTASWTQRYSGTGGVVNPASIAVATGGSSVLDQLGLPQGTINQSNSQLLTSATSVVAGDSFYVSTSINSTPVKVTIDPTDTLQTLATKINQASGYQATATVTTDASGASSLSVKAAFNENTVTLSAGPAGSDALAALGLAPAELRTYESNDKRTAAYGLNLAASMDISTTAGAKAAVSELSTALSDVRIAYNNLASPSSSSSSSASSGTVPAYLTAEISNYQAALARLTGQS